MESHIFVAPNAVGFTYNAHFDLPPNLNCTSPTVNTNFCTGTTTTNPCSNLDISFFTGNDPSRLSRILNLEQQLQLAIQADDKESLSQKKELEIEQAVKFELQQNGVLAAYSFLNYLLSQQVDVYRGDLAALSLRIPDYNSAANHISLMDSADPNKAYLEQILQIRLQGSDITELSESELMALIQTIEGQFPSIPRKCLSVPEPSTGLEGLQSPIEVVSVLENNSDISPILNTSNKEIISTTIQLYPNPTRDAFTLELPNGLEQKGTLSVFNANGQLVKQGIIQNDKQEWSTTDLPSGVYYIFVTIENQIFKEKLVIIQ